MAEMAKVQNGEQRIAGSNHTWGVSPFFHFQLLKYSRIIALFDTFLMSTLQSKECCLGS